ncbi:hypothetical protein VFPPC_02383 [Pochonia chlamydosporia 170]|uniref:Uncharacterized protein n=1 Tax=Pochonia chlamydosporia 170 TaxID=1380566 RepID=A0A179FXN0_METCM|nr:hypothetical protein VFPPC_02383 [Pochonia chlamydosporia 170]OAQ69803.1 hypothetical protein VFPPC_02383 [Pochonia chlamydosporia 170]
MRQDLQQKLYAEFPQLLAHLPGIETGDGWYDILYRMSWRICNYAVLTYGVAGLERVALGCVKEKFGGLRVYMGVQDPQIEDIVREAVDESWRTCERCGHDGELRRGAWLVTLCDGCHGAR